jgi:hypothetical protein
MRRTRRLHLVTFATAEFAAARQRLVKSALDMGEFEHVFSWDVKRLQDDSFFEGKHLLSHQRGVGYWSWKPHIILDALEHVRDGDVVVYYDAGRYSGGFVITRTLAPLIEFAERHEGILPGVAVPVFGPNARWTRRDCFVLMNCDAPSYWRHPHVQATFSLWIKSVPVLKFVEEWRSYCADVRVVGDGPNTCGVPNFPIFIDHRHDQSVLTNLVAKYELTALKIHSRPFELLLSLTQRSHAGNVFFKKIDNMSAVQAGTNPTLLYLRNLLSSKLVRTSIANPRHS